MLVAEHGADDRHTEVVEPAIEGLGMPVLVLGKGDLQAVKLAEPVAPATPLFEPDAPAHAEESRVEEHGVEAQAAQPGGHSVDGVVGQDLAAPGGAAESLEVLLRGQPDRPRPRRRMDYEQPPYRTGPGT